MRSFHGSQNQQLFIICPRAPLKNPVSLKNMKELQQKTLTLYHFELKAPDSVESNLQGILKALRPQKWASMDDEDWEELQQHAVGTIRLCPVDEIMYHVMNLKSRSEGKETIKVDEITTALLAYNQPKQNAGESSYGDSLYVKDCSDGDMLSVSTNQFMDVWLLDFGCSYHITPNREWFTSYRSGNSGSIYLGDDRCCNIVGVGDVRIKMYDGTVRTLFDVRHIPDLKTNLIFLGTLHKNDLFLKQMKIGKPLELLRKVWVYFLKQKYEVLTKFKLCKAEVENQTGRKIKYLRSDNGTEYTDSQFQKFCEEHRIQRHFSVRKTPQQNGVAERMNRSLTKKARCLRLNAGLPKSFWAEAVSMACYLVNRSPRASLGGKVAEEVWTGNPVNFDHLRIFGCSAYVHVPSDERSKLDPKSKQFIFLGYKKGVKGYKFWDPVERKW
ncbi:UNVERIFIED_CONTAM: Retrovirus-related Pol polyprotein from transposon TNT 1-94 [Sesamum latifolium]|uniref:Retrovirus-related Pol polyprotein from transposon TNT 1-94 n=1 Tax=Sesamum latifolium TaxID=2727402 RepID=A0AAW2X1X3_9LAMI